MYISNRYTEMLIPSASLALGIIFHGFEGDARSSIYEHGQGDVDLDTLQRNFNYGDDYVHVHSRLKYANRDCVRKINAYVDGQWHLQAFRTPLLACYTTTVCLSPTHSGADHQQMLLNWNKIDACFLFPSFQIRSSFGFFATCLGSFLLVISLEFLRRLQRQFDTYLRAKNAFLIERGYVVPEDMEGKLLKHEDEERNAGERRKDGSWRNRVSTKVVLEQTARGAIHMAQFWVSYCIMLLVMYSNGKET